jgi:hypothetical protein
MEESVSGFKCSGQWVDVVEHGERIAQALSALHTDPDTAVEVDEDALT